MVDYTEVMEGQYLTAELVKKSPKKLCVITGEGKIAENKYGPKLELPIEMDGKKKVWSPNKDSMKNLNQRYGCDSKNLVGAVIKLEVVNRDGKEILWGIPVETQPPVDDQSGSKDLVKEETISVKDIPPVAEKKK